MKLKFAIASTTLMLLIGCGEPAPSKPAPVSSNPPPMPAIGKPAEKTETPAATTDAATPAATPAAAPADSAAKKPVALTDGAATIGPDNSRIQFVGTHTGEKPDPRTGSFTKFSGKLTTDAGKLIGVTVDIDTDSLTTEIGDKLTGHLKGPDFLDTKEHPEIKFVSTKVESQDDGKSVITGDLTLHGETKPVTIPATVTAGEDGLTLVAEFTIDRAEFGMTLMTDKVEKTVSLTVVVGEKTKG